jgi:hypothetical protein
MDNAGTKFIKDAKEASQQFYARAVNAIMAKVPRGFMVRAVYIDIVWLTCGPHVTLLLGMTHLF